MHTTNLASVIKSTELLLVNINCLLIIITLIAHHVGKNWPWRVKNVEKRFHLMNASETRQLRMNWRLLPSSAPIKTAPGKDLESFIRYSTVGCSARNHMIKRCRVLQGPMLILWQWAGSSKATSINAWLHGTLYLDFCYSSLLTISWLPFMFLHSNNY